jgi:hypothetical protein
MRRNLSLYCYLTYPKKPASCHRSFGKKSYEFATVDRIAHAFKHVATGHERNADCPPLKAEDVEHPQPPGWSGLSLDLSNWGGAKGVTLRSEDGRDLLEIVKGAAAFIRTQIKS